MDEKKNEIILFENQGVKLEVNLKDETVWLTQKQIELGEMLEEIQTNTINSNSNVKEYAKQIISHLENIQKNRNLFERKNYMIISSFNNRKVAEIELKEFYQLLRYHLLI